MNQKCILNFKSDLNKVFITQKLNNPFCSVVPEIAKIAATEFQENILVNIKKSEYDFSIKKGKMFGVLVVLNKDNKLNYLGAVSGNVPLKNTHFTFVPSIFNDSIDDFFINKGMSELTEISNRINEPNTLPKINELKEIRKQKSIALQNKLFENYIFLNKGGKSKNALQIFEKHAQKYPPSAAGECAAPKLLQYAFKNKLKPIAIAEFWWGNPPKNKERNHKEFYPACKNKCQPILEYMLNNNDLFSNSTRRS